MKYQIDQTKCVSCLTCQGACPNEAIQLLDTSVQINQNMCDGCGTCAMICPVQAIESITEKTPVYAEEPENSLNEMNNNQSRLQDFHNTKIIIPNVIDELKRTVLDGFIKPRTETNFNRKEPFGFKGGRGRGKQNRRKKKW